MACSASSGVAISTNPKPRERPVSRSVTTLADSTLPTAAKASRRRSLEVEKDKPPTKSLTAMEGLLLTAQDYRSIHCGYHSGNPNLARGADLVVSFIEQLGYVGLFLVLFFAGLGVPIPEELPIVTGGVLSHQLVLRWWIALPVCFVGVLSGDVALYWVGHHWGERVLGWRPVRWVLSPAREEQLKAAYRGHGVKIVFTARHVMGLRAAAFLTAGIARVPFWKFLAVDAVAALVSVPFGFFVAFLFADQIEQVFADVHRVERWVTLAALVIVAVWVTIAVRRRGQRP
jgi:membrane protein DedA with SNARE-associated domain